jgi:hypothetical protein
MPTAANRVGAPSVALGTGAGPSTNGEPWAGIADGDARSKLRAMSPVARVGDAEEVLVALAVTTGVFAAAGCEAGLAAPAPGDVEVAGAVPPFEGGDKGVGTGDVGPGSSGMSGRGAGRGDDGAGSGAGAVVVGGDVVSVVDGCVVGVVVAVGTSVPTTVSTVVQTWPGSGVAGQIESAGAGAAVRIEASAATEPAASVATRRGRATIGSSVGDAARTAVPTCSPWSAPFPLASTK